MRNSLSFRKTSTARVTGMMIRDRENEVEIAIENQAGIKIGEIAVTGGESMIEKAEIVTGIMTGIVDMIVNMSSPIVMIQEVFADHVLDLGNIQGIMIATGAMTDIRILLLSSWVWKFVFVASVSKLVVLNLKYKFLSF